MYCVISHFCCFLGFFCKWIFQNRLQPVNKRYCRIFFQTQVLVRSPHTKCIYIRLLQEQFPWSVCFVGFFCITEVQVSILCLILVPNSKNYDTSTGSFTMLVIIQLPFHFFGFFFPKYCCQIERYKNTN